MTNPDHKQINNKGLSRREALLWIGKVGGSAAMLQAAGLFGLLTTAPVVAQPELVKLKPLTTGRKTVLILGAGISGLVAAYELGKAGYQCKILEASHRAGGRNFTIRHGDFIDELGNPQFCNFDKDPDLYFNAGPARIPAHHTAILHYCREFAVEMQMFCNYNKNCYTQDDNAFAGKPVRIREYEADTRGFFSELMAKSIQAQAKLDAPFDDIDKQKLIEFCRAYGDLSSDFTYEGSERAGYQSGGILSPGVLKKPKAFADLLQSNFWAGAMHFGEISDQSAALMTPVGGMDKIVDAFLSRLAGKVQLKAQVQKVQLLPQGVEVSYWLDGQLQTEQADYCLNCIPAQLMAGIENNFPADYVGVMKELQRGKLSKIALQAKERFWEKEQIYSGISWTNQDITQIWYPSHGLFKAKGILLGAYSWDPAISDRFSAMTHQERIAAAISQGTKLHPDYGKYIEQGNSICWQRMNHMLGCGAVWSEDLLKTSFATLQAPVGSHYMVGDQVSYHPGWQEGAVRSAWYAMDSIQQQELQKQRQVAV